MVLEAIIDPWGAKKHPIWLFFLGILFSSIAVIFSLWIFQTQSSLVMVFLTVVLTIPLMYATFVAEEEEDEYERDEIRILKGHTKALTFLSSMFMGFVVGYALWYMLMPQETVNTLFSVQLETIHAINAQIVALSGSGHAINWGLASDTFLRILTNNVKVLIFCVFFAFFFGAGSIFILAWNASVISAAVGTYFHAALLRAPVATGAGKLLIYVQAFFASFFRYMIHGTFEIVGYFIGALAGGIISVVILNHGFGSPQFRKVGYDAVILVFIAFILLVLGAAIEVFVTPMLF